MVQLLCARRGVLDLLRAVRAYKEVILAMSTTRLGLIIVAMGLGFLLLQYLLGRLVGRSVRPAPMTTPEGFEYLYKWIYVGIAVFGALLVIIGAIE
jgi:hypothetical protein